jgi:hypothetical protein
MGQEPIDFFGKKKFDQNMVAFIIFLKKIWVCRVVRPDL